MTFHVTPRKFDTDGEALDHQDDSAEFQRDLICVSPCSRIDKICRVRPEDDATNGSDSGFSDVETFLDDRGAKHEQTGETAENDINQMRSVDVYLLPNHDGEDVNRA